GRRLAFQRRQRHELGRGGLARRFRRRRHGGVGIEPGNARAELTELVAQLPVRLGEALETAGHAPGPNERREGKDERGGGNQPVEGQQTAYLTERLATVSTA